MTGCDFIETVFVYTVVVSAQACEKKNCEECFLSESAMYLIPSALSTDVCNVASLTMLSKDGKAWWKTLIVKGYFQEQGLVAVLVGQPLPPSP
jgi:hypothetical protein